MRIRQPLPPILDSAQSPITVLLRFHKGYGLGDAVQFTVVLKHLRKYRPWWTVDFVAERGREKVGAGLCRQVFTYGIDEPLAPSHSVIYGEYVLWKGYDRVIDVVMYDNAANATDMPNSRTVSCLREMFGIPYDRDLGRYTVNVGSDAMRHAADYFKSIGASKIWSIGASNIWYPGIYIRPNTYAAVLIHHAGTTARSGKDLDNDVKPLCEAALALGRLPVVLDWEPRRNDPRDPLWGGDAEINAALISQAEAFIGIDSGPGKVASATETPSLICWTGHHPMQFHDPAPNTVHLIPENHEELPPIKGNWKMADFFIREYRWRTYPQVFGLSGNGQHRLREKAIEWLGETLGGRE